jgi:hypothetical protein
VSSDVYDIITGGTATWTPVPAERNDGGGALLIANTEETEGKSFL